MDSPLSGRRVASVGELEQPGDYCGPLTGYTGDKPAVFFIPPVDPEEIPTWPHGRIHHVVAPPHVFRDCGDGSIEVRESIGLGPLWHGYLDCGDSWRTA